MSEIQFFQTRMGKTYYENTLPNLIREIHRLNDMLALNLEMMEKKTKDDDDDRPGKN